MTSGIPLKTGAIFDPKGVVFSDAGFALTAGIAEGAAITLPKGSGDGRILVAGGWSGSGPNLNAYYLTPTTRGTYSKTVAPASTSPHLWPLLSFIGTNDLFVLAGGYAARDSLSGPITGSTQVDFFDGVHPVLTAETAPLPDARGFGDIARLLDGSVLVSGGNNASVSGGTLNPGTVSQTADVFRLNVNTVPTTLFRTDPAGQPQLARYQHRLTLLPDGSVLVSGGITIDASNKPRMAALLELYEPAYVSNGTDPHGGP